MKELLIIRSASFQQLDLNLSEIKKKFPNHKLCLLTHEHGLKLAEKYIDIHECIAYQEKSGFDENCPARTLQNRTFDAVVVLVTNISGVGFDNVFRFALTIQTNQIYMCNLVSEVSEISRKKIENAEKTKKIYRRISYGLTVIMSFIVGILLLIRGVPIIFLRMRKFFE